MSEWTITNRAYKPEISAEKVIEIVNGITPQIIENITLKKEDLDDIDLNTEYYQKYVDDYNKQWFFLKSGQENYRLLVYLASLFSRQIIIDIGTHKGASAVALASNPNNNIYSFDIESQVTVNISDIPNIRLVEANIETSPQYHSLLLSSVLIFLDTSPHEGIFEANTYNFLDKNGFKGIIVFNDIHLGLGMENFWTNVSRRKFDLTPYGHWSGTGLILFNDTTEVKTV